jgi:hypothetical protein
MVVAVNILGLPSCAVSLGCDDGLPQGVQLIGARFREDLLLDAAQAIEDRAPVLTPIQPRRTVGVSAPGIRQAQELRSAGLGRLRRITPRQIKLQPFQRHRIGAE